MNTWTEADFITYVYQIVADADLVATDEEIGLVKQQVGNVLSKHFGIKYYSYAVSLKKIQEAEGVSPLNCTEVIKKCMPLFEFTKEAKADILNDLNIIVASDDSVSPSERDTLNFLRQQFLTVEMPLSW